MSKHHAPAVAQPNPASSTCRELIIYTPPPPPPLASVLDTVLHTISQYVYAPAPALHAATLWVAMTWIAADCVVLPLAVIQSPIPGSGKSTLLNVMSRLSFNAVNSSSLTPAVIYTIDEPISLFIDEADTFFATEKTLTGIINCGHTRANADVLRVGKSEDGGSKVNKSNVFYPKALAQLGNSLAPSTLSRAILIQMTVKPDGVRLEPLLYAPRKFKTVQADLAASLDLLRQDFFSRQYKATQALTKAGLSNRDADNFTPLHAIASAASPKWAARCIEAAKSLIEPARNLSDGQELLLTINQIMPTLTQSIDPNTRAVTTNRVISSTDLLSNLLGQVDFGWHDYNNGRELSTKMMANLLQPFGLKPAKHRTSSITTVRGYLLADLERAIKQYVPPSVIAAAGEKTTPTPAPTPAPTLTPTPQKHRTTQHREATKPEKTIYRNIVGSIPKAEALTKANEKSNDTAFDAAANYERLEMERKRDKKNKEAALREKNNQPPPPPTSVPISVFDDFEDIPF